MRNRPKINKSTVEPWEILGKLTKMQSIKISEMSLTCRFRISSPQTEGVWQMEFSQGFNQLLLFFSCLFLPQDFRRLLFLQLLPNPMGVPLDKEANTAGGGQDEIRTCSYPNHLFRCLIHKCAWLTLVYARPFQERPNPDMISAISTTSPHYKFRGIHSASWCVKSVSEWRKVELPMKCMCP